MGGSGGGVGGSGGGVGGGLNRRALEVAAHFTSVQTGRWLLPAAHATPSFSHPPGLEWAGVRLSDLGALLMTATRLYPELEPIVRAYLLGMQIGVRNVGSPNKVGIPV